MICYSSSFLLDILSVKKFISEKVLPIQNFKTLKNNRSLIFPTLAWRPATSVAAVEGDLDVGGTNAIVS